MTDKNGNKIYRAICPIMVCSWRYSSTDPAKVKAAEKDHWLSYHEEDDRVSGKS